MEEDSFVLLSSMSPKLNKSKPNKIRTPSKLALKRNIRRSLICDKYKHVIPEKDLVDVDVISASSTSTNSTENYNNSGNNYIEPCLSKEKKESIKNWLNDLPSKDNSNEIDQMCSSFFSNVSCVDGVLRCNSSGKMFNSTRLDTFNKDIKPQSSKNEGLQENKLEVIDLISSSSVENDVNNVDYNCTIEIIESSFDENKENIDVVENQIKEDSLKKIDGGNDDIICGQKEPNLLNEKKKTKAFERESITYKNPYIDNNDPKNVLKKLHSDNVKKKMESPWIKKFKNICDSDTDSNKSEEKSKYNSPSSDLKEKDDEHITCENLLLNTPCNKGDLDLLYELYGDSLSTKKDLFLNKTEPKRPLQKTEPKKQTQRNKIKLQKTEKNLNKSKSPIKSDLSSENSVKKTKERRKNLPRIALDYSDDDEEVNSKSSDKNKNINYEDDEISKRLAKYRSQQDPRNFKNSTEPLYNTETESSNKKKVIDSSVKSNILPKKKPTRKDGKISSSSWESGSDSSSDFGVGKRPLEKLYSEMIEKLDAPKTSPYFKKDKVNSKALPKKTTAIKKIVPQITFLQSLSKNISIDQCDITAKLFRQNFKEHRDKLYQKLFTLFNEKIFDNCMLATTPYEWNDRLTATGAYCCCKKRTSSSGAVERTVRFVLSGKVLDSADRLRDTLVHEMCHAATWLVNEVSDGHGSYWKAWTSKAMRTFPELPPIKRCHDYSINTKFTYQCNNCGYSFGRHTKSLNLERKRCGVCHGTFNVLINKQKKNGEIHSVPVTPKEPKGFALFVKKNYAENKQPNRNHADVMRILSEKFALTKIDK